MQLPQSLLWVEVDLPEILEYKEEILRQDKPVCRLERMRLDLANASARRDVFDVLAGRGTRTLIISEGLLIYMTAEQVSELARDLARTANFQSWVCDIASPRLLQMIQKGTKVEFGKGESPMKFAPAEGPQFFRAHGWEPVEVHSTLKTAARLKRLSPLMRFFALFPEDPNRMGNRPWSGGLLLRKVGSPAK
jgi:O-methyltransferase involved in polyketide biosynthesis